MAENAYTYAQTINFEVYLDTATATSSGGSSGRTGANSGNSSKYLGIASVDLPEITFQTQDVSGVGIGGTINYPSLWLTDSMAATLHWRSLTQDISEFSRQRAVTLQLYSAVNSYKNSDGSLEPMAIKIKMRVLPKKGTLGKLQPNELMDNETEFEVIRLEVYVNGSEEYLIDKVNYVLKLGGQEDMFTNVKHILENGVQQA